MRRNLIAMAMSLGLIPAGLPATALASHDAVSVDVRVGGGTGWFDDEAWIEFRPSRASWVALYAAFSDGSLELVFPRESGESHWVDGCEPRVVRVFAPCGASLDHVQAVASSGWFDPAECWVAWAGEDDWDGPRVVVVAAAPVVSWGYRVAWCAPARAWNVVRCSSWDARSEWGYANGRTPGRWQVHPSERGDQRGKALATARTGKSVGKQKTVTAGQDGAAHQTVRWTAGSGGKVKANPASGAKSSAPHRKTGEPERRSRR